MPNIKTRQLGGKEYEIHPNPNGGFTFTRVPSSKRFNKLPKKGRIRALGAGILALASQYLLPAEPRWPGNVLEYYSPHTLETSTDQVRAGRNNVPGDISSLLGTPSNTIYCQADALASPQEPPVFGPNHKGNPEENRARRLDEIASRHYQDNFPLSFAIMNMNPGGLGIVEQNLLRLMQDYPNMTSYIEKTAEEFEIPFSLFAALVIWESGTGHKHACGFVEDGAMGYHHKATRDTRVINRGKWQNVREGKRVTSRSPTGARGAGITGIAVAQYEMDMKRRISHRTSGRDIPIGHSNMDDYAANMVVAAHMLRRALGDKFNLYGALLTYNRGEGFFRKETRVNRIGNCNQLQDHIRAMYSQGCSDYSEACKMPENVLDIANSLERILRTAPSSWSDPYGVQHTIEVKPDEYLAEEVARAYHKARRELKPPMFAYRNTTPGDAGL